MFCRSFEGALAALGAPLVGIIADRFFDFPVGGTTYQCSPDGQPLESTDDLLAMSHRATSLGDAMLVCMLVPWVLCLLIYTALHWTYPKDRVRAVVTQTYSAVFSVPEDTEVALPVQ